MRACGDPLFLGPHCHCVTVMVLYFQRATSTEPSLPMTTAADHHPQGPLRGRARHRHPHLHRRRPLLRQPPLRPRRAQDALHQAHRQERLACNATTTPSSPETASGNAASVTTCPSVQRSSGTPTAARRRKPPMPTAGWLTLMASPALRPQLLLITGPLRVALSLQLIPLSSPNPTLTKALWPTQPSKPSSSSWLILISSWLATQTMLCTKPSGINWVASTSSLLDPITLLGCFHQFQ